MTAAVISTVEVVASMVEQFSSPSRLPRKKRIRVLGGSDPVSPAGPLVHSASWTPPVTSSSALRHSASRIRIRSRSRSSKGSSPEQPRRRTLRALGTAATPPQCEASPSTPVAVPKIEVREVATAAERDAAEQIHWSKSTFHEERELVRIRIHEGDPWRCRSWVLVGNVDQNPGSASSPSVSYLAAVTLRLNPYANKRGMWAQVLNMSVARERQGLGTTLIAGLQELLRREFVDVMVLYPAANGRAPAFWYTLGFAVQERSFLPEEELVPLEAGGPLMPEFDVGLMKPLPRWEKRLLPQDNRGNRCSMTNNRRSRTKFRLVDARDSKLSGDVLLSAATILQETRGQLRQHAPPAPL